MSRSTTQPPAASSEGRDARAREEAVAALGRLERGERDSLREFQDAICRYVAELRARGLSRGAAIVEVRALVATPASAEGEASLPARAREALVELSTRWCVAEYGRDEGSAGPAGG
jgi:hypothetical protein